MASLSVEQLNQKFGIAGLVNFEPGNGGLVRPSTRRSPWARCICTVHVTQFQPRGREPVLFLSKKSLYRNDKPIRGGVPICFPWFGPARRSIIADAWLCG